MDALIQTMAQHGVHTLILYGSHARGDATAESDVDVAGFADIAETLRDARPWEGTFLDAFVYPTTGTPDLELLKLLGGIVLVDDRGLARPLLDRLEAIERAGPPALPEHESQMRRVWAHKMVARIRRGDLEAHYRRHWLLYQLLEDHFALRRTWYRGPKLALAALARDAPETHAIFTAALAPDAPLAAIEALVDHVAGDMVAS